MNKIYITGDCHGSLKKFTSKHFPEGKTLDKGDYLIILGDFGLVWDYRGESKYERYWLNWLNNKPWTTLFIDGNHENFDRLNNYEVSEWCGGRVCRIRPSVFYLKRGEIFNICGKRFLALGGAKSHDIQHGILDPADYASKEELRIACLKLEAKHGGWQHTLYRIKGINWWPQEIPTSADLANAFKNLHKHDYKVDYILSHEAPLSAIPYVSIFPPTEYSKTLESLDALVDFKHHYFGHYHLDENLPPKLSCHFDYIERIC